MTDNEIVKALSICSNENGICFECPYSDDYTNCNTRIAKDAIDLINRLQAENEESKNNCEKCAGKTRNCIESLQNIIAEQKAENERLKDLYEKSAYEREMFLNELTDAKAEA